MVNCQLYTIRETAELLKLCRASVYDLVNRKQLRSVRVKGKLRVRHDDLEKFLQACIVPDRHANKRPAAS